MTRAIVRAFLAIALMAIAIGVSMEIYHALGPGQMLAQASFLSAALTLLFYALIYIALGALALFTFRKLK